MPNEQTSVPLFTSGEVLTAANMNISAGTGVPVFTNTTTRDAAFGGANEKVLAEGQLCYLSSTNVVQYYDGAAWATVGPATAGALTYITGASFSAVTSFSLAANTFSATYENYLITMIVTTGSNTSMSFRMRAAGVDNTSSNYRNSYLSDNAFATATGDAANIINSANTVTSSSVNMFVYSPQLSVATQTMATGTYTRTTSPTNVLAGTTLTVTTSYDAMTFLRDTGTITGSYKVYGLANS